MSMEGQGAKRRQFLRELKGNIKVPEAITGPGSRNSLLRESLEYDRKRKQEEEKEEGA